VEDIAVKLEELWQNQALREELVAKGIEELTRFSWETCSRKTIDFLLK